MNDYLVSEFENSVDSIVSQPIQQTQRIKYTAYDVSNKFIIFGASSGGLYIFNRYPCSFIKLIPSTEGSVVFLSISYDEKLTAVATSKGTICLINNEENVSKHIQIYNEHQGNVITALKWHQNSNELYSGDTTGKICVVMTKTVFQIPCATLMQLDSRIVQLDWASNFLLVSTLSRVYLCDTQSEHYRQIGKKLRDGEFGACFFGIKFTYTVPSERKLQLGSFSILNDKESFTSYEGLEHLKIFCARPGVRIWEVQLNGTVVRTHEFKHALKKGSNKIITLDNENNNSRLDFKSNSDIGSISKKANNFLKMYIFNNQYILTFQKNGLYILDPQNVAVIFWTNVYTDIIDVRIVKNFIYIWTAKNKMHVLLFSKFEDFIIKCLLNKRYLLCADLCIYYQSHIKKILSLSKNLYLLSCLGEKLIELNEIQLKEQVQPVLDLIKEFFGNRQLSKKLSSGIFVVDNGHFVEDIVDKNAQILDEASNIQNESSVSKTDFLPVEIMEQQSKELEQCCSTVQNNSDKKYNFLLEEFDLNKIDSNYKTHLLETVFQDCQQITEITDIFEGLLLFLNDSQYDLNEVQIWCYETCLRYIELNKNKFTKNDIKMSPYIGKAFVSINYCDTNSCECGFPLPKMPLVEPKLYKIGQAILEHLWNTNSDQKLCFKVPYLWRDVIKLRENENIENFLSLLIQYGDITLLNKYLHKFTYDLWNDFMQKIILLKQGTCLNCEKKFDPKEYVGFSWSDIASKMVKSISADNSVNLLLEYAEHIPKAELNFEFYQSCIFSKIMDNFDSSLRTKAMEFVVNVNKNKHQIDSGNNHFGKLLEKSLANSQTSNASIPIGLWKTDCFNCCLPLQTPVLCKEKYIQLPCGHCLHNICYQSQGHDC